MDNDNDLTAGSSDDYGNKTTAGIQQRQSLDNKLDEILEIIWSLRNEQVSKEDIKNTIKEVVIMELADIRKEIENIKSNIKEVSNSEKAKKKLERDDLYSEAIKRNDKNVQCALMVKNHKKEALL